MGGGLMQLVAYGAQDVYLTGNPQITFFKIVYRRHTNFSMEAIEQNFNGTIDFGKRVSATISRNGDLITNIYLKISLPAAGSNNKYTSDVGFSIIKNVELDIGGQLIDKQYGEWMHIWKELTVSDSKLGVLNTMIDFQTLNTACTLHVPLFFYFCRNPGLALPLISLQYHEVKINMEFNTSAKIVYVGGSAPNLEITSASLWVDYIYLDTDERRRFAQINHEYLIEQIQYNGEDTITGSTPKVRLNFNHPVKEFFWIIQRNAVTAGGNTSTEPFNFKTATGANPVTNAKLVMNGHDRFAQRVGDYFNLIQPYQHHTASPNWGINCYSFALEPEGHQPSGTCNFSRIDNATLNITSSITTNAKIRVYAMNYNILRVMSGMGGLAYSN
jgi:hypothetical protein